MERKEPDIQMPFAKRMKLLFYKSIAWCINFGFVALGIGLLCGLMYLLSTGLMEAGF